MTLSLDGKPVAVELFSTSILSNHKVRSRHERFVSVLTTKKIPYVYHDLASDPEAKSRWRRKAVVDPSIPGLLVHNEWRGTFPEFEEAVEFGELDLFLRIDHERLQKEAAASLSASTAPPSAESEACAATNAIGIGLPSTGRNGDQTCKTRNFSCAAIPPPPPFAPVGSGKRAEFSADEFLDTLGIQGLTLSDADVDSLLNGSDTVPQNQADELDQTSSTVSSTMTATGERIPSRTYIPSANAGVKPLRFARMGSGTEPTQGQTAAADTSAPQPSGLPSSMSIASSLNAGASSSTLSRYNVSQRSGKALAAEAAAMTTSRQFSGKQLRDAVASGHDLRTAMEEVKARSFSSSAAGRSSSGEGYEPGVVGAETADELLAQLGLGDIKLTDEEADAFLRGGEIPQGLESGGERLPLHAAKTPADKARDEAAAREVALKARQRGYGQSGAAARRTESVASIANRQGGTGTDPGEKVANDESSLAVLPFSSASTLAAGIENVQPEDGGEPSEPPAAPVHADIGDESIIFHSEEPATPLQKDMLSEGEAEMEGKAETDEADSNQADASQVDADKAGVSQADGSETVEHETAPKPSSFSEDIGSMPAPTLDTATEPNAAASSTVASEDTPTRSDEPSIVTQTTSVPLLTTAAADSEEVTPRPSPPIIATRLPTNDKESVADGCPVVSADSTVTSSAVPAPMEPSVSAPGSAAPIDAAASESEVVSAETASHVETAPTRHSSVSTDSPVPSPSATSSSSSTATPSTTGAETSTTSTSSYAASCVGQVQANDRPLDLFPPAKPRTPFASTAAIASPSAIPNSASPSTAVGPSKTSELATSPSAAATMPKSTTSSSFEDDLSRSPPKFDASASSLSAIKGGSTVTIIHNHNLQFDSPAPTSTSLVKHAAASPDTTTTAADATGLSVTARTSPSGCPEAPSEPPVATTAAKKSGHRRTLSDILREADAAMEEGEDIGISQTEGVLALDYL
ncbi:hypothetical protein K437DRAFT_258726 [Tilletiaria anomala UBC 951]|uniref:SH3 domain-containing protein n=1 Tax=Tilletiaria anomala (strain ATCC 24038 / CBS 436.72 / UBC 951) TaxID=1037660 RepID=A0A066VNC2_TILAU|nr:uncharacterized protein K437DRAFT_258726 [Tilletiaria anomala UBC 951]KDN40259.1 hypothetical protein K437DRAFT_258726 [Tilletiaria anomala UBC 951]